MMGKRTAGWLMLMALFLAIGPLLSGCGPKETPVPEARPTATPKPTEEPVVTSLPLTPYRHSSGLFEISYPEGWLQEDSPDRLTFSNQEDTLGIFVHFSDIGYTLDSAGMREFIDEFFAAEGGIGDFPAFARADESIQPDGSILVEYSFEYNDSPAYGGSFFEQRGTIVYVLTFVAMDADEWDSILPTFNEVANSFTVEWSTLTSVVGGYAIDYPISWEAGEDQGDAYVERDEETFLLIQMVTDLPSTDPDEAERLLTEDIIDSLLRDDPNAQIVGPDTIIIGEKECSYIDFVYVDPDTGLENTGTAINLVYQGVGYKFILFTLSEDFDETADIFVGMLMSFRFLD